MDDSLRKLRSEGTLLKASMQIGKSGLTEQVVKNIKAALLKERLVKIKIHPSFIEDKDKKLFAEEVVDKTGSRLIQLIGFTIVLGRK
jgi:RNA-binding protein